MIQQQTALGDGFGPPPSGVPASRDVVQGEVVGAETVVGPGIDLAQEVKNLVRGELVNFLDDVEFRLAQSREVETRVMKALEMIAKATSSDPVMEIIGAGKVYAEDLNIQRHQLTGYTVTSNSPGAGSIAWASLHVVYNGVDYTITNGNTALKYVWFDAAVSTTVLQVSNTKPTLSGNACLLFVNNGGVVQEVLNDNGIAPVVANNSVDSLAIIAGAVGTTQIANGAVTPTQTSFYTTLANAVTAAQSAADLAQATADGSISTYFQSNAPWANGDATAGGASNPAAKVGDIWYDQDDGQAYRWSGAAGTPANTWIAISDSDMTTALNNANSALALAQTKITTFYAANASPPTATTIGDLWVVTDRDNLIRRASATGTGAWVDLTVGTQAIANTAITTAKIANQAVGTTQIANQAVGTTQIGNNAVGATQLGSGAVTPVKLNVLQHVLY